MSRFSGENLVCARGGRTVFAKLGFDLAPGQALILLGPNGSGKSSLLRVMAGLIRPIQGRLLWDGEPVADDPQAHGGRLHYVGHHDAVKPVLTVAETLAFWAGLHGGATVGERIARALDGFGLRRLADVPGRMLSAGQKRRLNLARLLAAPAPLWLLDEPSVALDRASVKALEGEIAAHRAQGGMVVVSTHADIGLEGARELLLDRFAVEHWP
ncbi:MAG: heme ABC exporter ATP-binding protein CcmA [Rhodospirillales bacterium]|nr:heme ABC exporter ATP-binding protein CcmA [Rhodospirillales bacterium]